MEATARQTLSELGAAIAAHMPGWMFSEHGEYQTAFLIPEGTEADWAPYRGQSLAIHLQLDHKRRLSVSGCWPHGQSGGHTSYSPRDVREESPTIHCASDRPPAKLAADILRRFLPEYQRIHALLVEHIAKEEAGDARQHAKAVEFGAIMGDEVKAAHASWFGDDCYGHVGVNWGGDTATLELRGKCDILMAALKAAGAAGAFRRE